MSKVGAGVVSFEEALEIVLRHSSELPSLSVEGLALLSCGNRVLAEAVLADRDQPPFDRSTRDGFAVRAVEFGSSPLLKNLRTLSLTNNRIGPDGLAAFGAHGGLRPGTAAIRFVPIAEKGAALTKCPFCTKQR